MRPFLLLAASLLALSVCACEPLRDDTDPSPAVTAALQDWPSDSYSHPHKTWLTVSATVAQGDFLSFSMDVTNTGQEPFTVNQNLCGTLMWRVVDAVTGEVVRPLPTDLGCLMYGATADIAPGETLTVSRGRGPHSGGTLWDLQTPSGELLPPGDYVLQVSFRMTQHDYIRPPDARFTVTPMAPDGGVAAAATALSPRETRETPKGWGDLVTVQGQQQFHLTVPDERAKRAFKRLAQEQGVSLARVRFQVLDIAMPPRGDNSQLTVTAQKVGYLDYRFTFKPNGQRNQELTRQSSECSIFVSVTDTQGERVFAHQNPHPAEPERRPDRCWHNQTPYGVVGGWDAQYGDGQRVPPGTYTLHAGLRYTFPDGSQHWLSAAPTSFEVRAEKD